MAPMPDTQAVTLWVLFGTGSKYETKKLNGISHFLEHLFFKGTKKRPRPGQIWRELDKTGSQKNAFTSKEFTGYYVKSASKFFDVSLDVVSDILLNPLFKKEEIEKERGVILQEISMYEDDPRRQAYEILEELLYGDCPAGWDTAGYPQTVKNIARDDIVRYKNSHYLASNAVVVVAGNVLKDKVFAQVERAFAPMGDGRKVEKQKVLEKQSKPQVKFKKKDADQTHVRIAARAFSMYDERRFALSILQTILGGYSSSRLWTEIREKAGLTYYVGANAEQYTDTGYVVAGAGVPHGTLPKVVKSIIKIFRDIKTKGVSEREIKLAKDFIAGSMPLAFESTDEVATYLASQELFYNKIMLPEEILAKIDKVKRIDIIKAAKEIFTPQNISMVAIGPHDDTKEYEKILSEL